MVKMMKKIHFMRKYCTGKLFRFTGASGEVYYAHIEDFSMSGMTIWVGMKYHGSSSLFCLQMEALVREYFRTYFHTHVNVCRV
jgi:hypothetical protein